MNELNLRAIESRSWKARQQDGLFDIYFGALMLAIAISALTEVLGATSLVRLVTLMVLQFSAVGGLALAKRRYVTPRVGAVKFGATRARRSRASAIALAVCVFATVALVVLTAVGRSPVDSLHRLGRFALPTVVTLIVGIPLTALAIFLQFERILLHATLFAAAAFALAASGKGFMAPLPAAIAFGASGAISVGIGLLLFARFARRIPRKGEEMLSDEG